MKKPVSHFLQTLLSALCLICAFFAPFTLPADASESPSSSPRTTRPSGLLYKISHDGHSGWLFGTIHVGRPDMYPLDPETQEHFKQSQVLALEFDTRDTKAIGAAMQSHGTYADGDELGKHLAAGELKDVLTQLTSAGMPAAAIPRMKPWVIANALLVTTLESHQLKAALGTEQILLAQLGDKPVASLESADSQMKLFDDLPAAMQSQYLGESIRELKRGETVKKTEELLAYWRTANRRGFEKFLAEAQHDRNTASRELFARLVTQRNPQLAHAVGAVIDQHEASFIAIGTLHLVGSDSVATHLRRLGYTVEQIR